MEYIYKARDHEGKITEGHIEAVNEVDAVGKLQNMDLYVIDISNEEFVEKKFKFNLFSKNKSEQSREKRKNKKINKEDIIFFFDQMAVLLDAGIDIIKSLDIVSAQIKNEKFYSIILNIKSYVSGGASLSNAMRKYPELFVSFILNLIEIGETSGKLPEVLNKITKYLEQTQEIKRKLKTVFIYPCVLLAVSFVVIAIFMFKVIPTFQTMFAGFNIELPKITQLFIVFSGQMQKYFLINLLSVILIIFFIRKIVKIKKYRYKIDKFILKIPVIKQVVFRTAIVRFASSFNILLENGVSIVDSLELLKGAVGNIYFGEEFGKIKQKVNSGATLSESLKMTGVFPLLVVQLIGIGEETGKLPLMLNKISVFYEKRLNAAIDMMSALTEPLVILIMGGIIGTLVISMFLPIFKMSQIGSGGGVF
jgi:type IV pilus assembly protein PilC